MDIVGMTNGEVIEFLLVWIVLLIIASWIARWFLGINDLVKEQKEQTKLLTDILNSIKQTSEKQ